ncbi:acetyltransferase [Siphonobacter sp. BAB-5385]|uniref:acyltransferase n=1 Tax=Siphonobacter sp. BAB-5385 TaxID=1864822 RepID=UPI000B9DE5CE|nr:acyltransferase [Siphonobacter sp. BAB-5385]OZI07690.1 acetyltransferase [Siphonobacter sp. BAB-5385]
MAFKQYIDSNPGLKKLVHWLLIPKDEARPRRWVSWFVNPFVHRKHRSAVIRSSARMDVLPFKQFTLGSKSVIESYCVINNGVGDVFIGDHCTIGISSVVIGPVHIGSDVIMAQHVTVSGLNHMYEDVHTPIHRQPVTTAPIVIEDECWIGANAVITAGVTIGRHSVVAGGSVVTKNVPPYSVVGGNPARLLKQYDAATQQWVRAPKA